MREVELDAGMGGTVLAAKEIAKGVHLPLVSLDDRTLAALQRLTEALERLAVVGSTPKREGALYA